MDSKFHVSAVCNALVDIVIDSTDQDLQQFGLNKGIMHLVDTERQNVLLRHFEKHDQTVELGGSAMNAIRALSQLKLQTMFVGKVGKDAFGQKIRTRMENLGIHAHLGVSEEASGSCIILVTPDGERTMNTHLGASRLYDKSDVPMDEIKNSEIFHFCGYQWDTEDQKDAILAAIDAAKTSNTKISFDVADPFVVQNHKDQFLDMIQTKADIVFANQAEAELLYGKDAEFAGAEIAKTGAIGVIKLGAKGAKIFAGDEVIEIAPVKTEVIDTTAAGDMFAGGFLYAIAKDLPLDKAGLCAATLASDVISRYGATLSDAAVSKVANI